MKKKRKLGIALGSGAARGWAHIGVLRALAERDLVPDIICGASSGSLVAAACASGQLDVLEAWARGLTRMDVLSLLDARFSGGGMFAGSRVMNAVAGELKDHEIESLKPAFAAVATDLETGREVWIREGKMLRAVRASSGFPGLFQPVQSDDGWLIDGGVVNPVPVSLCFALGADQVIAVDLNAGRMGAGRTAATRHAAAKAKSQAKSRAKSQARSQARSQAESKAGPAANEPAASAEAEIEAEEKSYLDRLSNQLAGIWPFGQDDDKKREPTMFEVVSSTVGIMQQRITRSRMVGEPPQVQLTPQLGHFELMDFHLADEAIREGKACVARKEADLEFLKIALQA